MSDLKSFIDQRRATAISSKEVDWMERRKKWLVELHGLCSWIALQLREAGLDDESIERTTHSLSEEKLGRYQAEGLHVTLPDGVSIFFKPIAGLIVGGYGRVDVTSRLGPRKAVLIAGDADADFAIDEDSTSACERGWAWRVYPSSGLRTSYALDAQGLTQLLSSMTA